MAPGPLVLIGDDDAACRGVVRAMLELEGYAVSEATDGEEVLRAAASDRRPELILLDLGMPARSGMDVLATMRSDPDLRAIPVVVLTATSDESSEWRARELGAAAYVVKPVRVEDVRKVVGNILGRGAR